MPNRPKPGDRSIGNKLGRNLRAIYGGVGDAMLQAEPELVNTGTIPYDTAPYPQYATNGVRNFFTGGRYNANIGKMNASSAARFGQQQGAIDLENLRTQNDMELDAYKTQSKMKADAVLGDIEAQNIGRAARIYGFIDPELAGQLDDIQIGKLLRTAYGSNLGGGLIQGLPQARAAASKYGVETAQNEALLPGAGNAAVQTRDLGLEKERLGNQTTLQALRIPKVLTSSDGRSLISFPGQADNTQLTTGLYTFPGFDSVTRQVPGLGGVMQEVKDSVPRTPGVDIRATQPISAEEIARAQSEAVQVSPTAPLAGKSTPLSDAQLKRLQQLMSQDPDPQGFRGGQPVRKVRPLTEGFNPYLGY